MLLSILLLKILSFLTMVLDLSQQGLRVNSRNDQFIHSLSGFIPENDIMYSITMG